ncbi:hypothetical protein K439DRAFT_1630350 [Ramaria rubella]|nr:hypothetical protein K439DRAFT_1643090 [Ramaria rubella]KAF8587898.1 hypothetical protein K439DRAFT_1630350 [Ramaria rubella]
MLPPAPAPGAGALNAANHSDLTPSEMLATLGVSPEQFRRHQEQLRRSFMSSQRPARPASGQHTLPFPLNLPPSYPTSSGSTAPASHPRPRRAPSVSESSAAVRSEYTRALSTPRASSSDASAKRSLDAFMDSRPPARVHDTDSSSSDSDTVLRKVLPLPQEDFMHGEPSAFPSSSPPSSSPVRTPRETSPLLSMHAYPSSPTPRSRHQPSTRADASDLAYTLPPGPYSPEKPSWSLAALIGQAINAAHSGALPLNDIYTYISTVYPHYNRRDQPWMSSVRHSLSVNDAFERVPDQERSVNKKGKSKGMTRLKGGLWRIKPEHQDCFIGGNFIRKGAKGSGPGKNLGPRKRRREDDGEHDDKKTKTKESSPPFPDSLPRASSRLASSSLPHSVTKRSPSSPSPRTSYSILTGDCSPPSASTPRPSSPPSLSTSQSTLRSDFSPPDPFGPRSSSPVMAEQAYGHYTIGLPSSPDLPLAQMIARKNSTTQANSSAAASPLEPGFQLERTNKDSQSSPQFPTSKTEDMEHNRDLFTRVLASNSQTGSSVPPKTARLLVFPHPPSSPLPGPSFPARPTTPPSHPSGSNVTLSPIRTPMSHRGLHMSPSRSLAHYKSSLEPEWKSIGRPTTPQPRNLDQDDVRFGDDVVFSTPKRPLLPSGLHASPFRTPARPTKTRTSAWLEQGYDPYDPNTLLADELARHAKEPQESPGGFFGKEGKKLLYDSPSVPGRSDWRFQGEL